jgi:hypothetical protein
MDTKKEAMTKAMVAPPLMTTVSTLASFNHSPRALVAELDLTRRVVG